MEGDVEVCMEAHVTFVFPLYIILIFEATVRPYTCDACPRGIVSYWSTWGLDDTGLYLTAARAVIGNVSHVLIGEWHCSLEEPAEASMEAGIVMR